MASIVSQLVALTSDVTFDRLPATTVTAAKRAVVDALGCAVAAIDCEPSKIAARAMPDGRCGEATVIGERDRSPAHRTVRRMTQGGAHDRP